MGISVGGYKERETKTKIECECARIEILTSVDLSSTTAIFILLHKTRLFLGFLKVLSNNSWFRKVDFWQV